METQYFLYLKCFMELTSDYLGQIKNKNQGDMTLKGHSQGSVWSLWLPSGPCLLDGYVTMSGGLRCLCCKRR